MPTTTIRVDAETHARLVELSKASGATLIETVSQAAEALHRERFARTVVGELAAMRSHKEAWDAYLAESDATSVSDGLGR